MDKETRYFVACYGIPADMPKARHYATMTRKGETRTHGPLTSSEWAHLVEQETCEGWELVETKEAN